MDLTRERRDPGAELLPPLVLDRQRVVHCAAFRRLQHKTQVFITPASDHFRTRLTHTLEVAHVARCLAERLELNADLAEVVALAHDLGHPPFGHAGERGLDLLLAESGGFEHNRHTLRIVEELEHPYPEFRGLNLTRVVRECLAKHSTQYDRPGQHPLQDGRPPPPEGAAVDLADRVTYALHDLQDGLYAELVRPASLAELPLWRRAYAGPALADDRHAWRGHLRPAIDRMLARVLDDAARSTPHGRAPRLSDELEAELAALDRLLKVQVYQGERLRHADAQARQILADVFAALCGQPERLPDRYRKRIAELGVIRVVTDYVAGMTDRYCLETHAELCG